MKYRFGIKIVWSNNRFLPKAKYIYKDGYSTGHSNEFENYTYRWYPAIIKIESVQERNKRLYYSK